MSALYEALMKKPPPPRLPSVFDQMKTMGFQTQLSLDRARNRSVPKNRRMNPYNKQESA